MSRRSRAVLAAVPLLVAGCGAAPGDRAGDQTPGPTPAAVPTGRHTGSSWPRYPVADYDYELSVSCFCPYAGIPFTVTVRGGRVKRVVHVRSGPGHVAGEHVAPEWARLTINDVIDEANDPAMARVEVRWAKGSSHPSWVSIDRIEHAVDDEIAYRIRDVEPVGGTGRPGVPVRPCPQSPQGPP